MEGLPLSIGDGEFFTFVGPSGCGKSTLLNLIAGLDDVTEGSILFDGVPAAGVSPRDRDVAMVFQSYALYPHMTVRQNIAFPLLMRKEHRDAIEREVGRVAEVLGIGDLLGRRPRELSGGQRQRVALGRAIIRKPKVFLMDEPLSNLDARLRIEMRVELKRLHRELGITTVYVTHDQAEAMGLSDRMAVMHRGRVHQVGAPQEVYRGPADLFVAGFIGSPPMNFIPAHTVTAGPLVIDFLGRRIVRNTASAPEGGALIAGVRPEDLHALPGPEADTVEATVLTAEPEGPVTWIEARRDDARMRARAGPDALLRAGDRVHLRFSAGDVLLFDAASGVRI